MTDKQDTEIKMTDNTKTLTILIADDDRMVTSMLSKCIAQKTGHSSIMVHTGAQAEEAIGQGTIDFIIFDNDMCDGGPKGETLARKYAGDYFGRIILHTSDYLTPEQISSLNDAGIKYVSKPSSPFEIIAYLKEQLDK